MKKGLLLHNLNIYAWKVICQQFGLLAVLSILFCILPVCAGPVAENLLNDGVDFSGITLAVCSPEDDDTDILVEELVSRMRDISRYATIRNMDQQEAYHALEEGHITAILLLPDQFISRVLSGDNPDVTVVVHEDQPLEALLTLWLGQNAADLLTTAQKGIYVVLDISDMMFPNGYNRDQVVMEINMIYINKALNRQDIFHIKELSPTGAMDIRMHYGISLIIFLCLCLAPVFWNLLSGSDWAFRKRLAAVGCSAGLQMLSCWFVMCSLLILIMMLPVILISGWNISGIMVMTLFACGYCAVCCLISRSVAVCGCISVAGAAVLLYVSGGIIPTPLLPQAIRRMDVLFPVTKLREMLFLPYVDWDGGCKFVFVWIIIFFILAGALFYKKLSREEEI